MRGGRSYSMTDAARILAEPAHRLIYLCEQGVVVPDVQESEGRGTSRLFSARNLFDFAVALRLRDASLPVGAVRAVLRLLRSFEREVASRLPRFEVPGSLREGEAPDLRLIVGDGRHLYYSLGVGGKPATLFGPIDLSHTGKTGNRPRARLAVVRPSPSESSRARPDFGGDDGSRFSRLEVSITRIAQALDLGDES